MDWSVLKTTAGYAAPCLSLTFLGMGVVRYFRESLLGRARALVRAAFAAYALHIAYIVGTIMLGRVVGSDRGAIFLSGLLIGGELILLSGILCGLLSRTATGRRVAMAGLLEIVAFVLGDLFLLSSVLGNMAV